MGARLSANTSRGASEYRAERAIAQLKMRTIAQLRMQNAPAHSAGGCSAQNAKCARSKCGRLLRVVLALILSPTDQIVTFRAEQSAAAARRDIPDAHPERRSCPQAVQPRKGSPHTLPLLTSL